MPHLTLIAAIILAPLVLLSLLIYIALIISITAVPFLWLVFNVHWSAAFAYAVVVIALTYPLERWIKRKFPQ